MSTLAFLFALILLLINLYQQFKGDATLTVVIEVVSAVLILIGLASKLSGGKKRDRNEER